MSVNEKMTAIADAIRDKTGKKDALTLDDMVIGIDEVFHEGYGDGRQLGRDEGYSVGEANGYSKGYEEGYEKGKAEGGGDNIWDDLQSYGARKDYQYACRGWYNLKRTVKPNFDIRPTNMSYMFYSTNCSSRFDANEMDLSIPELEQERGIKFDTSECKYFQYAFAYAQVSDTGVINARIAENMSNMLLGSTMVKTTHIILPEKDLGNNYNIGNGGFNYNSGLENITFEGTIFRTINLQWATKLTVDSMKNIISCLKNYSGTENDGTYKLSFSTTSWELLEVSTSPYEDGLIDNQEMSWKEYVVNKGWSV